MAFRINDACDGCSACVRQCPTEAIFGTFHERYRIDARRCIDCGVCGEICPIEAVVDAHGRLATRVPRDERLRPVFDLDLCNGCGLCIDYCPFDCLQIVGGPQTGIAILARPLACVSCTECREICIKGAVAMRPVSLRRLDPNSARKRVWTHLEHSESAPARREPRQCSDAGEPEGLDSPRAG